MLFRSLILGAIVGILTNLILIAIAVPFHIWALSKGVNPFLKFAPGYTERGIEILAAAFIIFGFSATAQMYGKLLVRSGKTSNKFITYALTSIITFFVTMFLGRHSKIADALFFSVFAAVIFPACAEVLLVKVLGRVEKFIK
jgi:Mn2+/Fe2+ NRAMP family transporter